MSLARLLVAFTLTLATPALAQAPDFRPGGAVTGSNPQPVRLRCWSGSDWTDCSLAGGGGGGGGAGDASASNQTTQITAANLTNARLGDLASPATGSVNQRLSAINVTLGTPFQAGGAIANTAFGASQSGTWNLNNITGTISLPTGAATASGVAAVASALPARDANGDLRVPTVTVTAFFVSLSANTSTELLAASSTRIGYELQCTGTADVGLSSVHAVLTKAVPDSGGSGNVDTVLPAGSKPMYLPSYVNAAGVTAYSGAAQVCWGKSYARQ